MSQSVDAKINLASYNSFETYYFYPLFFSKISFEFLSTLITFVADNNYNHHNNKSRRQQMKDRINYWDSGKAINCF
jgi:oligoendopeptidase F